MTMTIKPEEYKDLKEYWDFQRKIEYNKEKLRLMTKEMTGKVYNQFGMLDENELFDSLWCKLPQEAYENPHPSWVPENETYRLWNEEWPSKYQLPKPKGRPVVLRAKSNTGPIKHPYDEGW
jgi:hypothetical protein|tara:strand:+ start:7006 stop:7368 length:363 start_codon:yes stop_codon:yes gene_type:complete